MAFQDTRDCTPYDIDAATQKPIAPCGAIANSMFNDTFTLEYINMQSQRMVVPWTVDNLVWNVDKYERFKNPVASPPSPNLCDAFKVASGFSWSINHY